MPQGQDGPSRASAARPPSSRSAAEIRHLRLRLALAKLLGPDRVGDFLEMLLRLAGRDSLPTEPSEFHRFVDVDVVSLLLREVRLDAIAEALEPVLRTTSSIAPVPASKHPRRMPFSSSTSRALVLVVWEDGDRRRAICAALVRDGFDVETTEDPDEVARLAAGARAVVMRLDEAGLRAAQRLADAGTQAGLVTFDVPEHREAVRSMVACWPSDRVAIAGSEADPPSVTARVRIVTA